LQNIFVYHPGGFIIIPSANMKNFCFIFVFASLYSDAQLLSYLKSKELSDLASRSSKILRSPDSLEEAYHALKIASALNNSEFKCNCNAISKLLKSALSSYDYYYGFSTSSSCSCPLDISGDVRNFLKAELKVIFFPSDNSNSPLK